MPTFHGVTSVPTDNGSNSTTQITLTPPASMVTGDLVVVTLTQRGTATFSVGVTGGQTWTSVGRDVGTTNVALETYWARYNGTWAANPRFDFSAGTNTTAVMIVFRPDDNTKVWATEQIATNNTVGGTVSISNISTNFAPNVTLASWSSPDDNTWGSLTGTGWVNTSLSAQYRNLAGNDSSSAFAYQFQSVTGATNATTLTQNTLGPDDTVTRRITFYETVAFTPSDPFGSMGIFGL